MSERKASKIAQPRARYLGALVSRHITKSDSAVSGRSRLCRSWYGVRVRVRVRVRVSARLGPQAAVPVLLARREVDAAPPVLVRGRLRVTCR